MPWEGEGISPQSPGSEEYLQRNGLSATRVGMDFLIGGVNADVEEEYEKPRPPRGYMDNLEREVQEMRKAWRDTV